ncbi:ESX-1 secretion-associated protein EspI [Mycobacteroides abscessus subsp. abscessus]|nr:ESX-1 secretion-associated protein EspI [Mycobacteroides abscessus subsp. abscessus]
MVVVNASRRGASTVDLDQLRKLFLDRTRAVQVVPFDDHLAEGAEIDLELVSKPISATSVRSSISSPARWTGAEAHSAVMRRAASAKAASTVATAGRRSARGLVTRS